MNPLLSALVAAGIISPADAERINRSMDADAMRAWAEQQMAVAVQNGLSAQQTRLVDLVRRGNVTDAALADFWRQEDERLFAALRGTLEQVGSEQAIGMAVRMGADDAMWRTVNEAVLSWVNTYYTSPDPSFVGSVPNLNVTAREQFAPLFEAWNRGTLDNGGRGLPQLVQALEPVFGPARAERIAVTEVTRVFTESIVAAGDANEAVTGYEWLTANDEIVCPVCAPLNGRRVPKSARAFGTVSFPPAHPNCRCSVTEITLGMEDIEAQRKQPAPQNVPQFKTTAEASKWAKDALGVEVDYTPVTLEQAQSINQAIGDVQLRYNGGQLVKRIEWTDNPNIIARGGATIQVNPANFNQQVIAQNSSGAALNEARKAQERLTRLQSTLNSERGFWSPDEVLKAEQKIAALQQRIAETPVVRFGVPENMRDIIVHELGHNVQGDLLRGDFVGVDDFLAPSAQRAKGLDPAKTLVGRLDSIAKTSGHLVSEYATTNAEEYFAESFTAYLKGERDNINAELLSVFGKVLR